MDGVGVRGRDGDGRGLVVWDCVGGFVRGFVGAVRVIGVGGRVGGFVRGP